MIKITMFLVLLGAIDGSDGTTAATTGQQQTFEAGTNSYATSAGMTTKYTLNTRTTQANIVPRYDIKNFDGETCILMQFTCKLLIQFSTLSGQKGESEVLCSALGPAVATGNCMSDERTFQVDYQNHTEWQIHIDFEVYPYEGRDMFLVTQAVIQWNYEEPFFPDDVQNKGSTETVVLDYNTLDIRATVGNTFKCDSRSGTNPPATFTMEHVMIQPYAQKSKDKGNFGEQEECSELQPTLPPARSTTRAPSISTGGIVGIVVGLVAVFVIVVGGSVYYSNRKRFGYSGF